MTEQDYITIYWEAQSMGVSALALYITIVSGYLISSGWFCIKPVRGFRGIYLLGGIRILEQCFSGCSIHKGPVLLQSAWP